MDIDAKIRESVELVATYANECEDWGTVKNQILINMPFAPRKQFSIRDDFTKEQKPNDLEKCVIRRWKKLTGVALRIKKDT